MVNYGSRVVGLNHIYFDSDIEGFSNVATGLVVRALGSGLRVAYVDCSGGNAVRFSNFLENLCLSYSFVKMFPKFSMDIFSYTALDKVSRTLIPHVEFVNIDKEMFWKSLVDYDLIVFDSVNFDVISKFKIMNFLSSNDIYTETAFVFDKKKDFDEISPQFDLISEFNYEKKASGGLSNVKSILNVTGSGHGKSVYGFGFVIRSFILKKDVKLIYFDKGGDLYGEQRFFFALKKWAFENDLYGKFDFVSSGVSRFDKGGYREGITDKDISEAREGLMLLKTSLLKQTPVIADELNTMVSLGVLNIDEIMDVLSNVNHELVITGESSPKEILDISSVVVDVVSKKDYLVSGKGYRKGIDF